MSAPLKNDPSGTAVVRAKNQPNLLANGFVDQGQMASKPFKMPDGRDLLITVFFPENCTAAEKNRRLQQFTQNNLQALGQRAISLGLGRESAKEGKGMVNSITFKQDEQGQLTEAQKRFTNGKVTILNEKYYQDKAAKTPAKKDKIDGKKRTFEQVQAFWRQLQTGSTASVPNKQPDDKKTEDESVKQAEETKKEMDEILEESENESGKKSDVENRNDIPEKTSESSAA